LQFLSKHVRTVSFDVLFAGTVNHGVCIQCKKNFIVKMLPSSVLAWVQGFFFSLNFCFVTTLVILWISQIWLQFREESRFLKILLYFGNPKGSLIVKIWWFPKFFIVKIWQLWQNTSQKYISFYMRHTGFIFCHQVAKIHQKETLEIKGLIIKDHNWV